MDYSDHRSGPAVIALWGTESADSAFPLGTREYDWHSHVRGQLFCVESGVMHVRTPAGSWLLPPHRMGWLPPDTDHKVTVSGALSGWGVLIAPSTSGTLPTSPCVMSVSSLLRSLIVRAASWAQQDRLDARQERLVDVLLDEVRQAPLEPLHLPMPTDPRLLRIAESLAARPGDPRSLDDLARVAALSSRTARRLFKAQTGMGFSQWRQQARLIQALERLARGEAVAAVSDALGYATPSNFIAMFRRALGHSPARYFHRRLQGADRAHPHSVVTDEK